MNRTHFVLRARKLQFLPVLLLFLSLFAWTAAHAQIAPLGDSYINTADPTTNFGSKTLLDVDGASQTAYIQFNLASIPSTASVSQATLKLYVNAVTTAGSFNVDYVNAAWSEGKIDASNAPALGKAIASNVSVTTADKNQYILVDVTSAVQAWLSGSETNNGLALVANSSFNATFDSKENTTTSHPAELDIAFAGGDGTITGITTASGSGLTGGGTSGTLNLSLTDACTSKQVLQWSGSAWTCSNAGTGTITGVTAGLDLTGGGGSGNVTLNLDTTKVPLLTSTNAFTGANSFTAAVSIGTNTPTHLLEVDSNAPVAEIAMVSGGTDAAISLKNTNTGGGGHEYWIDSGSGSAGVGAGNFAVWDNTVAAPRLVVNSSGNVGIGTTAPGAGLDMAGGLTINAAGSTAFSVQYEGSNAFALNTGPSGDWLLYDHSSGSWTPGIGQSGGLVGINVVPGGYDDFYQLAVQAADNFTPFIAYGYEFKYCIIDDDGDLNCTGTKNAVVPVDGGARIVAMSAIESPVNWFEDAGSARLANGVAVVDLDSTFIQTVNTTMDYKVFPVPNGDCKGLYVTNKTATSFEVHELGGGTSNVDFDYRIMAVRKNYETVRFADRTSEMEKAKRTQQRTKSMGKSMGTTPQPSDTVRGAQAVPKASQRIAAQTHTIRATAPAIQEQK
jgi:hypothetical protein